MKKLNAKGISHLLIPIVVVFGVATVGTYMLVSSHADSCSSAQTSCTKTVVSSNVKRTATCTISGVPANVKYGESITPTITVTSTGNAPLGGKFGTSVNIGNNRVNNFTSLKLNNLQPGKTKSFVVGTYTITGKNVNSPANISVGNEYDANNVALSNFGCVQPFNVVADGTISATCTIIGVPAKLKYKQIITPATTITNTGTKPFSTRYISYIWYHDAKTIGAYTHPDGNTGRAGGKELRVNKLLPGQSVSINLLRYKARYADPKNIATEVYYDISGGDPALKCRSSNATLQAKPTKHK